jgi:hypothetical protein
MFARKHKRSSLPKHLSTAAAKHYLGDPGNASFWGWVRDGEFGPPIRLGPRKLIWETDKLEAFVARRAAQGYTPNYSRGLVGHNDKLDAKRIGECEQRRDPKLDIEADKQAHE